MYTLVGSRALHYWLKDEGFKPREGADWDYIQVPSRLGDYQFSKDVKVEIKDGSHLNDEVMTLVYSISQDNDFGVMSLEGLAIMKRSHLHRDWFFDKHITMYHKWLKPYLPTDGLGQRLLKERIKLTKQQYPQRNPSLNQSNDDFFDDNVKKEFEHDWLHELVAYYDRPLFESLKQPEGFTQAWCERDLWDKLSLEDQNKCVAEEAHVIACERFMIPNQWDFSPKKAYFRAIRKVCTTLTSGWFRDHAIDNFPEIVQLFDINKFNTVKRNTT